MAQQQLQDLNPPGLVVALIDAGPERAAQRPERVAGAAMVRAAVAFGPDEPMCPADGGAVGPVMEAMAEEVRDFVDPFGQQ